MFRIPAFLIRPLARLLRPLFRPLYGPLMRSIEVQEPWVINKSVPIPLELLGPGAKRDFHWYLDGATSVHPENVDAMCDWLAGCTYAADMETFHERDFWQHPKTFELLRKGDCEDFALWAWRSLLEMNIDATFYIGRIASSPEWDSRHAWVVFSHGEDRTLLEPAAKRPAMLRPFEQVERNYEPYYAVGRDCLVGACQGLLLYFQRRDGFRPRAIAPRSEDQQ